MNVSEAIQRRMSVRAFTEQQVSREIIQKLLEDAAQSPSGSNLQPWHVHALTGGALKALLSDMESKGASPAPGYAIYPESLAEPYRTRRYQTGEGLYATLGIPRDNKAGRMQQLFRNANFFGAPVGLFVMVDRQMGAPQWADLGIYIQSLMLLAVDAGLDTCAQAFWAMFSSRVEEFLDTPNDQMLFCGIALGYRDETAQVNEYKTSRAPFSEWGHLHGFDAAAE